ncbi:MAG: IS1 family transposase [Terriglobales bacterium]
MGAAAAAFHDSRVRGLKARRILCDEIWSFISAKQKNTTSAGRAEGIGHVWTWIALDADTRLCVSYLVGGRDGGWAWDFMQDVAARIRRRVQFSTDGHKSYLEAIEGAFGLDVDLATLHKIYGAAPEEDQHRCNPARNVGYDMKTVIGSPGAEYVSTSFVERQNLAMRMSTRRFTRLTKKLDNHAHAVALHFLHYNFARIHKTLRATPAMEAGIADHVWTLEEISELRYGNCRTVA